jgi:beta-lactamase regulating signal transducer with metallopeptidase domain
MTIDPINIDLITSDLVTIGHWISPAVMRPLGWALLHFLWQGTALAALAAVAMQLCRRASIRHALGVGVLALMLAAPLATFLFYWQADSLPAPTVFTAVQSLAPKPASGLSSVSLRTAPDIFPLLVEVWLVGVLFFSLRCAGGVLLLERMRRRQALPINARLLEICRALQRRLRLTRAIRFCECTWLDAPAVIGWFRPIVLLPVTALTGLSEDQLQAVIAHELAHIKRLDAFVNAFQIAAETVLFYHPAVWWLNRRIRAERENACDDVAVVLCGDAVEYARALTLMEEWRSAPALAMAANRGPLAARIARLLGLSHFRSGARGLGVTASLLCLTAALVVGIAILGMAHPKAAAQSGATFASATTPSARPATPDEPSPATKPVPATPSSASIPASAHDNREAVHRKSVCKKSLMKRTANRRQTSPEVATRGSSSPIAE